MYIEKISADFDVDYYDAMELYFDDMEMWTDYYSGERVSGFHPSWERLYGSDRPPVLMPEQRAFLKDLSKRDLPGDRTSLQPDPRKSANPFDIREPDLKLQAALLKRTPALAEQLIVSAGRDPRMFGL